MKSRIAQILLATLAASLMGACAHTRGTGRRAEGHLGFGCDLVKTELSLGTEQWRVEQKTGRKMKVLAEFVVVGGQVISASGVSAGVIGTGECDKVWCEIRPDGLWINRTPQPNVKFFSGTLRAMALEKPIDPVLIVKTPLPADLAEEVIYAVAEASSHGMNVLLDKGGSLNRPASPKCGAPQPPMPGKPIMRPPMPFPPLPVPGKPRT